MTRHDLRAQLADLKLESGSQEDVDRGRMIELLDTEPKCFERSCFPGHFTGSALVVSPDGAKALLHHHRFLDRWLQFGGHCDGDENVVRVAEREALEESGIEGLIVASRKPFDVDIHAIPENPKKGEPAHFHYDVRYMLISPEGASPRISDESNELRWFSPAEMLELPIDAGLTRLVHKWLALLRRRGHHV